MGAASFKATSKEGVDAGEEIIEKMEYADPELAAGNEPFYFGFGDRLSDHL